MTILHHVMHNNYTGADSRTLEDTALCSSDALFHMQSTYRLLELWSGLFERNSDIALSRMVLVSAVKWQMHVEQAYAQGGCIPCVLLHASALETRVQSLLLSQRPVPDPVDCKQELGLSHCDYI